MRLSSRLCHLFYKLTDVYMPLRSRAQISTEYLVVVSFVTLLVVAVMGVAFYYSSVIRDQLRYNNLDRFASTIIAHSEDVYYAGEPSQVHIRPYLPSGVQNITVGSDYLYVALVTSSGVNSRVYKSNVPLAGSLTTQEGVKRIQLVAQPDKVLIVEG